MIQVKVEVRKNNSAARIRGIRTATDEATRKTAKVILDGAKQRVRRYRGPDRDTGTSVYDSLEIRTKTEASEEHGLTLQIGSFGAHRNRPVARWLNSGTVKMHAFPFLTPAITDGRRYYKKESEAAVQQECAKNDA